MQIALQKAESLSGNCWIIRLSDFFSSVKMTFCENFFEDDIKSTHTTTSTLSFLRFQWKMNCDDNIEKNPSSVIWKMIWIPVILANTPLSTRTTLATGNFKRWRWCITFVTWLWFSLLTSLFIQLHSSVPSVACLTESSASPRLWKFKWKLLSCANRIWQKLISLTFQLDYFPSWK